MYFKNLQVCRGWAAVSVVLYHLGFFASAMGGNHANFFKFFDERFSYGAWFFFSLSGFLMSYLIDTGYRWFLPRRMLRIYPTFLLIVAAIIFGKVVIFGQVSNPGLWKALVLLPFGKAVQYPLGIEWSLVYEIFFYLVCGIFANRYLRDYFPYFLLAWLAAIAVGQLGFHSENWLTGDESIFLPLPRHIVLSMMNVLFIVGGLAFYVFKRLTALHRTIALPLLAASAAIFIAGDRNLAQRVFQIPESLAAYDSQTLVKLFLLGTSFSLLLLAACVWEKGRPDKKEGFFEKLGDASYGIYLIHVPVITVCMVTLHGHTRQPVPNWASGMVLGVALVVGWFAGKVDVSIHNFFKQRLFRGKVRRDVAVELPPLPLQKTLAG
jgi:peptidoglycan/LPS O-acetylase OafA/YrhL